MLSLKHLLQILLGLFGKQDATWYLKIGLQTLAASWLKPGPRALIIAKQSILLTGSTLIL